MESTPFEPIATQDIDITRIDATDDRYQFREQTDVPDSFVEDLKVNGQMVPIAVMVSGERYTLLDGFTRLAAMRRAGYKTIRATIFPQMPPELARIAALKHNLARKDLTVAEKHSAMWRLRKHGHSTAEIAKLFEVSSRTMQRNLTLPPWIARCIDNESVSFGHALVFKTAHGRDPKAVTEAFIRNWCEFVRADKLTSPQLKSMVWQELGLSKKGRPKTYARISEDEVRLYAATLRPTSPRADLQRAVARLEEARRQLLEYLGPEGEA